ncbi:gephyrin-like molybdotransferase receptor GlpR [uncultured Corynebacterium sp.]|uniref:divisome protein SepX/GlpR n=1 Tax=uncultured Corynebacterium sp. TaxID=159447 RepID=UPI0025948159|nr:gephyrin-like molybdotransferase receptor GlpR [uncultured Corynebacterium sp.]
MSTSLLLILIVVLWLFVLAPLVVNTRKPIRRTSDALGKTRVLHRGGEELATTRRRPSFKESDVRVTEEVDDSLETVDAQVDDDFDVSDVLIDDTVDEAADPAVVDGDIVYELEAADAEEETPQADDSATEEATAEFSDRSDMDVSDNESADQSLQAVVDDEDAESDSAVASAEGDVVRADGSSSDVSVDVRRQFVDADDLMFEDATEAEAEPDSGAAAETVPADVEAVSADALSETEEAAGTVDEQAELDETGENDSDHTVESNDDAVAVDDTLTEDDYAFAEKRRGRGGFDPISDAQYAETRFARRRRSVAGLAAFIAVTVIIAAFAGGWTWWIPLVGVGLMTLYLVNLRRTVRAEQELRARRIRRMKMARLGVRNREDDELGIPQRLRRPGAVVVELDDEDPDFADLAYTDYRFDDDDYDEMPQARVS